MTRPGTVVSALLLALSAGRLTAQEAATADKRDADYAVAKEKCDAFAGAAKDNCRNEAKSRFGK